MPLFGKSWGKKESAPQSASAALAVNRQDYRQQGVYADTQPPTRNYGRQRPHRPQADQQAQPQGWIVVPYPPAQAVTAPNYILAPLSQQPRANEVSSCISRLKLSSVTNLLAGDVPSFLPGATFLNGEVAALTERSTQHFVPIAELYDLIALKFDTVVTLIDGERFSGDERELVVYPPPSQIWHEQSQHTGNTARDLVNARPKGLVLDGASKALVSTNYFAKVNLYANSRLPLNLPPMKLYFPTFPLLCLAAQYSERVYTKPSKHERETHVDGDWRMGTKAMVIKSLPMDDRNTIVFAIRGSQTFMDWAVNLHTAPVSPEGFLDDSGNLCHAGFLTVARKMIKPVAARLRSLLQEDPSRASYSLLITGHSAGGAVAALLYSHMLSTSREAESELNILTGCFKRIHCVTFGAPPVSLLPLSKPANPLLRKSLFLSFINEGDPVPRADKAYVRSLLDLYATPAPGHACATTPQKLQPLILGPHGKSSSSLTVNKIRPTAKKSNSDPLPSPAPVWRVPQATLSNAGRLVLLRSAERNDTTGKKKKSINDRMDEGVVAQMVSDELLRGVIWGDPVCHMMRLYARRIEILATNALMGKS